MILPSCDIGESGRLGLVGIRGDQADYRVIFNGEQPPALELAKAVMIALSGDHVTAYDDNEASLQFMITVKFAFPGSVMENLHCVAREIGRKLRDQNLLETFAAFAATHEDSARTEPVC